MTPLEKNLPHWFKAGGLPITPSYPTSLKGKLLDDFGFRSPQREEEMHASSRKRAEWKSEMFELPMVLTMNYMIAEWEAYFRGYMDPEDKEVITSEIENVYADALIGSDASQEEIDFLTHNSDFDPFPTHKIYYPEVKELKDPNHELPDRGVIVIMPPLDRPKLRVEKTVIPDWDSPVSGLDKYVVPREFRREVVLFDALRLPLPHQKTSYYRPRRRHYRSL